MKVCIGREHLVAEHLLGGCTSMTGPSFDLTELFYAEAGLLVDSGLLEVIECSLVAWFSSGS
jgi:hypothetical protein